MLKKMQQKETHQHKVEVDRPQKTSFHSKNRKIKKNGQQNRENINSNESKPKSFNHEEKRKFNPNEPKSQKFTHNEDVKSNYIESKSQMKRSDKRSNTNSELPNVRESTRNPKNLARKEIKRNHQKQIRILDLDKESIPKIKKTESNEKNQMKQEENEAKILTQESALDVSFNEIGLNEDLQRAITESGYVKPTPIQQLCIPHVLEGKDILGAAQTGTGKTAAFALPILQKLDSSLQKEHLNETKSLNKSKHKIRVLVLSPTRELAIQIGEFFTQYGKFIKELKNTVIYGGVKQHSQVTALHDGVDILVATPGRLLDLIGQKYIKLNNVEMLVFDEADRMLDMGFQPDVQRIMKYIPKERQTLMYSATVSKEIVKLASTILHDPIQISVSPKQLTVEAIEQVLYHIPKKSKSKLLMTLLKNKEMSRVLIFSQTKHGANKIVNDLGKLGIVAQPLHGNKTQNARQQALHNFKDGLTRVIVATDVASRGLDVEDITHVIQYDLPREPETYVHRIGRTGRAGTSGIAISFCDEAELPLLKSIEKLIKKVIPVNYTKLLY